MTPGALDIAGAENRPFSFPAELQLAALRAHPRFAEAVRVSIGNVLVFYGRNRPLGWFFNDRTLTMVGHATMAMDADASPSDPGSGLTPGRFKGFCAETGLCSEGRAAAVLAIMRLGGYLEAEPHPADRRITLLRPTAKMLEMIRNRLRIASPAVAMLCPEVAPLIARLGSRGAERAMYREFGRRFLGGYRVLHHAPQIKLFAERDKGMLVLCELMRLADPAGPLPPSEPLPLSLAALARRFHVSRTHVLRLVRDAEAAGLLARTGAKGEWVRFEPPLREGLANFFAASFQMLGVCVLAARDAE